MTLRSWIIPSVVLFTAFLLGCAAREGISISPARVTVDPGQSLPFRTSTTSENAPRLEWSVVRGPGAVVAGRYHAPYVIDSPQRATVRVAIETSSPASPGVFADAEVRLRPGAYPGSRDCAGANQTALPEFGEFVFVDELPEAVERVEASYPERARELGIEGTVIVHALVCASGSVLDGIVVKSIPQLDSAALEAVRQWRFRPARAHGDPVAVWVGIPIRFRL